VKRAALAALVAVWAVAAPVIAQEPMPPAPPPVATKRELLRKYVWSTLGPAGALHATIASGLEQWRGSPPAWDADWGGYTQRWASEYGESAISDTTKYAVARLFHHDPSFVRCECTGVAPRVLHAISGPFMARTRDGRTVWSLAPSAGIIAGHVVSATTWYPAPRGTRDGVQHAAVGILTKMAVDVFHEFKPKRLP